MIFTNYDSLDNIYVCGYQTLNQVVLSGRSGPVYFLLEYVILLCTHSM